MSLDPNHSTFMLVNFLQTETQSIA